MGSATPASPGSGGPADRGRPRRALRRLGAAALGLSLALVLLEGGLQVASLFVRGERVSASAGDVVCQGDSNTYGLHLPAEQAYPAQLEQLIRARAGDELSVANLGVPGKTSWVIARQLPEDLARRAARAVVVWCGVNDFSDRRPEGDRRGVLERLRTVKMIRRLLARMDRGDAPADSSAPPESAGRPARVADGRLVQIDAQTQLVELETRNDEVRPFLKVFDPPEPEEGARWLREGLVEIVERARAAGRVPILVYYPSDDNKLGLSNAAIREAALETGARCVDPRPHFAAALQHVEWDELMFADYHPTRLGYSIIARLVLAALIDEGLVEAGPVAPGTPVDPLEEIRDWRAPELVLECWREDGRVVGLRAHYEAGHRVQLVVAGARGATPMRWIGTLYPATEGDAVLELPLELDDLARDTLRRPGRYLLSFEADGSAAVRFDDELLAKLQEREEAWAFGLVIHPAQVFGPRAGPLALR